MDNNEEQVAVSADLLRRASAIPGGVKMEEYNPMEKIPTLTVGDDFEKDQTIVGYYDETQILASPKFVHSKTRNADGIPTSLRHVLRIGSPTGEKLAIWSCGELKLAFEKLAQGTLVSITYRGKGKNAKGQDQHFFDLKRGSNLN